MTNGERNELVMRHLERAYRASHSGDSKAFNKERGDNPVENVILEAIMILERYGTPTTI